MKMFQNIFKEYILNENDLFFGHYHTDGAQKYLKCGECVLTGNYGCFRR